MTYNELWAKFQKHRKGCKHELTVDCKTCMKYRRELEETARRED